MEIFIRLRGCLAFSMRAPSFSEINGNPGKQDQPSVELKESPPGACGRTVNVLCTGTPLLRQQGDCRVNAPQKLGPGEIRDCSGGGGYFSTGTPSA